MAFLFGGARPPPHEIMKELKHETRAQLRKLDREDARMQDSEKKMQAELTRIARGKGTLSEATAKAKELVRARSHRGRLRVMRSHIAGLAQNTDLVRSATTVQNEIAYTTRLLMMLNTRSNVSDVHRMLREFERQTQALHAKQEITEECMDEAFAADDEEEATDEAVTRVLEEAGMDLSGAMSAVGRFKAGEAVQAAVPGGGDLEERLQRLRAP